MEIKMIFDFLTQPITLATGYFVIIGLTIIAFLILVLHYWRRKLVMELDLIMSYLKYHGFLADYQSKDTQKILQQILEEGDKNGNLARNLILTLRQNIADFLPYSQNGIEIQKTLKMVLENITTEKREFQDIVKKLIEEERNIEKELTLLLAKNIKIMRENNIIELDEKVNEEDEKKNYGRKIYNLVENWGESNQKVK